MRHLPSDVEGIAEGRLEDWIELSAIDGESLLCHDLSMRRAYGIGDSLLLIQHLIKGVSKEGIAKGGKLDDGGHHRLVLEEG